MSHSPGPWRAFFKDPGASIEPPVFMLSDADGRGIIDFRGWKVSADDARLIASAPTMLGLLRRWADTMGADDTELGQETIEFLAKVDG